MKIKINGKEINAKRWDTVMSAAKRAGISIPSICHHDALKPQGACRLCTVQVECDDWAQKRFLAACDLKVQEGYSITTESEELRNLRRSVLDLLLARNPNDSFLLSLSKEIGLTPKNIPVSDDTNECILCLLCTRACEKMGCNAISVYGRGANREIQPPYLGEPDNCIGCGSCASICPVNYIKMVDTDTTRTIWNKTFTFAKCVTCGETLITEAYQEFAQKKQQLSEDYFVQCATCKRNDLSNKLHKISGGDV